MPDTIFAGLNMPDGMGYLQVKMIQNDIIAQNDPHGGPILDICFINKQNMKIVFTCAQDGLRCFEIINDDK